MPQTRHGNSRRKIKVLAILNIPQPRALALHKDRRRSSICRDHVRREFVDERRAGRIWSGIGVRQSCVSLQIQRELCQPKAKYSKLTDRQSIEI